MALRHGRAPRYAMSLRKGLLLSATLTLVTQSPACQKNAPQPAKPTPSTTPAIAAAPGPPPNAPVDRSAWNRRAAALNLPLFRTRDDSPAHYAEAITVLWRSPLYATAEVWNEASLRAADERIRGDLVAPATPTGGSEADTRRLVALESELAQSRPTLLVTDLAQDATRGDGTVEMVRHLTVAAGYIERLYARQGGTLDLGIAVTDTAGRAAMYRNQGPWCEAPRTERDPDCNAIAGGRQRLSGLYPADVQADPKFCEALAARADGKVLMAPFAVVQYNRAGELSAVPYHLAWAEDMQAVAKSLALAATALTDPGEDALRTYLTAAAQAFRDGSWPQADEAWAKMTVDNSRWYLRVGPDETYHEPCSQKAGFHLVLARIDQTSRRWQALLDPVKTAMETALAQLAGPPYAPRPVSFHLPDFIEIVLNAGDSRSPFGATIGQSLPNWGPVANEGRGRTVAMVNVGSDPDSRATLAGQVSSLLCDETFALFTTDPEPQRMSTVLHEAAHNLGPAHEYAVDGKKDGELFGGPLAATLEELKAQTAAMYLADWLVARGKLSEAERTRAHVADIAWAFGHIAGGMHDAQGKPKPYSQLAAIQVGFLLKAGAISWRKDHSAHNGQDRGCFAIEPAKVTPAVQALMAQVAGIKARGDRASAEALRGEFVDAPGAWEELRSTIRERWLRAAKSSYVYAIKGL